MDFKVGVEMGMSASARISWDIVGSNFTIRWANPLWVLAGCDPTTQLDTMISKIRRAAANVRSQAHAKFSATNAELVLQHPFPITTYKKRASHLWKYASQWLHFLAYEVGVGSQGIGP